MTESGDTDSDWRRRYQSAEALLMDCAHLLRIQALTRGFRQARPDAIAILAGSDALRKARRVVLLAGTFNPQTVAHVAVAEAARFLTSCDAVVWLLARVSVEKDGVERAALRDRVTQLQAYVDNRGAANVLMLVNAGLYADQAEVFRRTFAWVEEFILVVGYDKIVQILSARYYADRGQSLARLFQRARILVAPRGTSGKNDLAVLLQEPENRPYAHHIDFLEIAPELAEIASGHVRADAEGLLSEGMIRMSRLVTPEGAALMAATSAYALAPSTPSSTATDRYTLREQWLEVLAETPGPAMPMPTLKELVDASCADTAQGAAVRQWLGGARSAEGPKTVGEAIVKWT